MPPSARAALGSLLGAALAYLIRPFFHPPAGGVGFVTVAGYPKSWDYAVLALLVLGAFIGGAAGFSPPKNTEPFRRAEARRSTVVVMALVFLAMLFLHDHPYQHMDPFHEGEHLTPGFLLKSGERPYGDYFVLHGFATDGALDALVLGDPPSPRRVRRLQTVLDAATLALLVPIAAEVAATSAGMLAAVIASLCAAAALWVPVFPYYRLAPVLLATLGLLRFARTNRAGPLALAFASASLGVLWSFETGLYALAGTLVVWLLLRAPKPVLSVLFILPLVLLVLLRSDLEQFFLDSFVIIPRAIDAVWSLPAPEPLSAAGARYYLPPVFYGFLLALAWKRRDPRILIIAVLSLVLFRTAAGRVSWSHTRFATPLLGIALVVFVIEPLFLARRRLTAVLVILPLFFYLEIWQNFAAGAKLLAGWRARQRHEGLVPYPFATGKGIYTFPQNAAELAALNGFLGDKTFLDFSNERALYYLLQRKPPLRCFDIPMLSAPPLLAEAMAELNANPPAHVILSGDPAIANFDGVSNRDRVPDLAAWIDANYPSRTQIGRFTVASR
ncbi:MAG TPA: hypothetical protein VKB93_22370 [Thermoanaerobaculia bacterium]|nr:hypothetical protein [Thermoanaerobaculia bacterium]